MSNVISRRRLEDALEAAGVTEYSLRDDYSGRYMYGDTCLGIVVPSAASLLAVFAVLGGEVRNMFDDDDDEYEGADEYVDRLVEFANAARTDNMAYDTIVYFPGWTFDK